MHIFACNGILLLLPATEAVHFLNCNFRNQHMLVQEQRLKNNFKTEKNFQLSKAGGINTTSLNIIRYIYILPLQLIGLVL